MFQRAPLCRPLLSFAVAGALITAFAGTYALYASSELVAAVPLLGAVALLVSHGEKAWCSPAVGVLLSVATLVRTNLAIVVVAVGVLYIIALYRPAPLRRNGLAGFVIAGLVPPLILVVLYAAAGHLDLLWLGLVAVPLSYEASGAGVLGNLGWLQFDLFALGNVWISLFVLLLIGGIVAALARLLRGSLPTAQSRDAVIILVATGAALISTLAGATFESHYLAQVFPLAALALFLAAPRGRWGGWTISALALASCAGAVALLELPAFVASLQSGGGAPLRPMEAAATAIAVDRAPGDEVWALGDQLVLFDLDLPPILPIATHPDNIFRPEITAPLVRAGIAPADIVGAILARSPRYVLSNGKGDGAFESAADAARIDTFLSFYDRWYAIGGVVVYRRP